MVTACGAVADEMACSPNSGGESCREERRAERARQARAETGCERGDPRACREAASPPDRPVDVSRLRTACEGGVAEACVEAATAPRQGGSECDAADLLARGCTLGSGLGCVRLAQCRESNERRVLLERGCSLGATAACVEAAQAHLRSDPGQGGRSRAEALLIQGCKRNDQNACEALGRLDSQ